MINFLNILESIGAEIASKLAPWLTPLLSAIVIAQAMQVAPFAWPDPLAWLTGVIIEVNGVALISTALLLHNWNRDNAAAIAHRDPKRRAQIANLSLALIGVGVYFTTTLLLALVLKIWPSLATAAYGLFVALAGVSAINLALRAEHYRRVADYAAKMDAIEAAKQTRKSAQRDATQPAKIAQNGQNAPGFSPPLRVPKAEWREFAAEIFAQNPHISGAELGRKIGASERTGQNILNEFRNGHDAN